MSQPSGKRIAGMVMWSPGLLAIAFVVYLLAWLNLCSFYGQCQMDGSWWLWAIIPIAALVGLAGTPQLAHARTRRGRIHAATITAVALGVAAVIAWL